MCGIVGFTGKHQAAPILLDGLSKLEYRGYDSAGIAVRDGDKETEVIKAKGRLKVLMEENRFREPVALAIRDGQHMESHPRRMHTRMSVKMEMLLPYTTASLRTTRS